MGDSKTNKAIALGIGLSLALILVGIAVEVAFDKGVFEFVALGVGKLFGDTSLATYRNVKTDTPIRLQEAAVDAVVRAKHEGVVAPIVPAMTSGLQSWRPQEEEKPS